MGVCAGSSHVFCAERPHHVAKCAGSSHVLCVERPRRVADVAQPGARQNVLHSLLSQRRRALGGALRLDPIVLCARGVMSGEYVA